MIQLLIGTNFPFMKYRRFVYLISGGAVLATTVWLVLHGGPKLGVDFTGGTLLRLRTTPALSTDQLRAAFDGGGVIGAEIQQIMGEASEYLVRLPNSAAGQDPYPPIRAVLQSRHPEVTLELRSKETVSPRVGSELARKAFWAILGSLGGILLYVGLRYEFKFALGAVMALFHDVFVTLGVLCFMNREISLTVVAALLTIAGYSINDTIVVFDRIRERSKALRKEKHSRAMDISVNETLSRTIITAFTVVLTAVALLVWGGEVLRDFSLAMVVGVIFGTFSSIYVASALALDIWIWLDRRKGIQAE